MEKRPNRSFDLITDVSISHNWELSSVPKHSNFCCRRLTDENGNMYNLVTVSGNHIDSMGMITISGLMLKTFIQYFTKGNGGKGLGRNSGPMVVRVVKDFGFKGTKAILAELGFKPVRDCFDPNANGTRYVEFKMDESETGKVTTTDENIHNTSKLVAENFDEANLKSLYPPGSEPVSSALEESMNKTADMLLG